MAEFASAATEKEVILVSGDGEEFKVAVKVAEMSSVVKGMIGDDVDEDEKRIPLPNVKKEILSKVLEYCTHFAEEPMTEFVKVRLFSLLLTRDLCLLQPLQDSDLSILIQKFYVDYINGMDKEMFYHLTLAANYMDIKPLLDLCCAKIASMIKGKTPEEIRVNLDIVNDFTPEEEAQVRAENKWAEDL